MAQLSRLLPDLGEHIDVAHRRLGHDLASVHGEPARRDARLGDVARPARRRPAGDGGPLKGLYFVGHWTRPGGGITPVIVSAMRAARAVLSGRPDDEAASHGDGLVAAASAPSPQTIEAIHANLP